MPEELVATHVATPEPSIGESTQEPPHRLPGEEAEPGPDDVDDGQPLTDVVDEQSHQPRRRGSRAQSKMAAARINRLSTELFELREWKKAQEAKAKPIEPESSKALYQPVALPAVEFNEPEPTLEQFADKDDPYGAWQRELARYDRRKEAAEQQSSHMQAAQQMQTRQAQEEWNSRVVAHQQRLVAAVNENPAYYKAIVNAGQIYMPPVLDRAVVLDNQSADVALFLATHPHVLDELVLMTAAQPVTEQTVAITRRLLRQRMSAGSTGSVAPSPSLPNAPRPPNPVRTGAVRTGNEPPPEGSSVADHAKHYMPKR